MSGYQNVGRTRSYCLVTQIGRRRSRSVYRRFRRALNCSDSDNGVSRKLAPGKSPASTAGEVPREPQGTLFLGCSSLGWSSTVALYRIPIWRLNALLPRSAFIAPRELAIRLA